MQLLQTSIILTLISAQIVVALPAPVPVKVTKRSVTIERVAAGWKERDVLHSKVQAMQKFGMPIPANLKAAHVQNRKSARARAKQRARHHGKGNSADSDSGNGAAAATAASPTGSAQTTGSNQSQATGQTGQVVNTPKAGDVEFLSQITVGGQKIVMDFDTGSSDLWLFSTNLPSQSQQGHTVFDPTKSSTFQAADPSLQSSFSIKFGDASTAQGSSPNTIGTDVVDIGGAISQTQTIELADKVSQSFVDDTSSNGLVGLAFSSINTVKPNPAKTFFDTIADDLEQPILSANLRPNAPGSYAFGKIDQTAFTGELTEVPIDNSNGFWQFPSSSFAVGDGDTQQNTDGSPAIADTGTTLLLVDPSVFKAYYAQVDGGQIDAQGQGTFPCSSDLPDFTVAVGENHNAIIPGKLLNFQVLDQAGTTCSGAIQSNSGGGIQIYGDTFFKAQYTVFNIRKNTISVAPHA